MEYWAEVYRNPGQDGWCWSIYWRTGPDAYGETKKVSADAGWAWTRWGARRKARSALRRWTRPRQSETIAAPSAAPGEDLTNG